MDEVERAMLKQRTQTAVPWLIMLLLVTLLVSCSPSAAPPAPTRTPMPTFTPTAIVEQPAVDPNATATAQTAQQPPAQSDQQSGQQQGQPQGEQQGGQQEGEQASQPTAVPPTDTPTPEPTATPQPAEVVVNSPMNIRQGPGTNYNILGSANQGERFPITGKNQAGDWWQISYKGQPGWVFGQLVTPQNAGAVQIAQNIPAPPPPPPPTNTPPPQPTQPPAPTAAPAPKYKFNIVVVGRCERQPAGNWFEGTTYINGQPQNGYLVAFSYAPDGPIVAKIRSGPHEGYPGWKTGYYSHIINAPQIGPKAGNWFVWVVDDKDQRISEIGNWQSTGPGEGCNQAIVDFDSR
jgi:hypothetical protein